jgi:IMP dehydrogenase/GMP reductase
VLAGCREAPGEIMEIGGKVYKQYRGMGSLAAMKAGSAARYGRDATTHRKVAAEGIEALKEVSGSVDEVLTNLIGGVQSGMGYLGARTLAAAPREGPLRAREPRGPEGGRAARRRRGVDPGELTAGRDSWGLPSAEA